MAAMVTMASATYIVAARTTALGRRSMNTRRRRSPGVNRLTIRKPATSTAAPTRKYKTVATTPCRIGVRLMVPKSTPA
ncbi:Uncharacterised protein [Mycobacterium tuberculosis]|uniref:Uncharacterized protein n=1 Tax=Mycobacterium tuberculosis TaxID=1773 RepID=A0A0U0SDK9_MYCTX|nr:Uncharacterised protein [Mycobacterium tuberculosis]CKQ65109.1 Uncharacterised protein [Mycobacterium tuberculosis]CNU64225.1 Uncharacterised protein [Mycobacterium tuberculosis]COW66480.1 Uncharacterised protein [Mycobacterium tuberculosis]COW77646.1 Uncharacterised protein [Mycobacterium tuberculosis]